MTTPEINPALASDSSPSAPRPTVVVMAKRPVPGRVKTRLVGPLTPEQAAAVHAAMLRCVLARVARHLADPGGPPLERVLAVDGDAAAGGIDTENDAAPNSAPAAPVSGSIPPIAELSDATQGWRLIDQGGGDLGDRLDRVWRALGDDAVVFFGVDAPDVPAAALRSIATMLADHEAAVGPVMDGGYWTLAARRHQPELIRGIDWGSASVYHQTLEAAARAEIRCGSLPSWYDVDDPADLNALRRRLETAAEPALLRLRHELDHVLTGVKP